MTTKRRVFYSFHYKPDVSRASQVRNIGVVEGNRQATDQDWETITRSGDNAIKHWIKEQMQGRSCLVVLVGNQTASRKWINYEIKKAWEFGMGVVGIYIHGLKNFYGKTDFKGDNPFDYINFEDGKKLSSIVEIYNPTGDSSKAVYNFIADNISEMIEEAIDIRNSN